MLKFLGIPASLVATVTLAWWFTAQAAEPAIVAHNKDPEAHPELRRSVVVIQNDLAYIKAEQQRGAAEMAELRRDVRLLLERSLVAEPERRRSKGD